MYHVKIHPLCSLSLESLFCKAARTASSKISFTPSRVREEHSMYAATLSFIDLSFKPSDDEQGSLSDFFNFSTTS